MTTTAARLRDPMPLPQVEHNSCQSCVTAQARWMLSLSDLTGQDAVRAVDGLIGREANRPIAPSFCLPLLLSEGCQVIRYSKPDIDLGRLDREGLAYFREYYADDWAEGDDEFWTPAKLAEYRDRIQREHSLYDALRAQYPGQLSKAGEEFSLTAADDLLSAGYVIITSYVPADAAPDECHATLLYGREADPHGVIFNAYVPLCVGSGVIFFRHEQFAGMLRPFADAITRPEG